MNDTDLAWAAGFIDGEGCISIMQDRGRYTAVINVGQVSRMPLDKLQGILGGSVGPIRDSKGGHFQWRVYADNAAGVAEKVLPYLCNKAEEAIFLLRFQGTKGHTGKRVDETTAQYQTFLFDEIRKKHTRRRNSDAERLSEKAPIQ